MVALDGGWPGPSAGRLQHEELPHHAGVGPALGLQASLGLVLLATELDGLALVAHEALGVATVVFFVAAAVRASTDAATPSRIPRMGS